MRMNALLICSLIVVFCVLYIVPSVVLVQSGSEFVSFEFVPVCEYLQWALSIVSVCISISLLINSLSRIVSCIFFYLSLAIISILSLIASFLAINFHTAINYTVVKLVAGTDTVEASEFVNTYLLDKSSIFLLLGYALFVFLASWLYKRIVKSKTSLWIGWLSIAFIVLSVRKLHEFKPFFTTISTENVLALRKQGSFLLYDPLSGLYNSYLQIKEHKNDFNICYEKCDDCEIRSCTFDSSNIVIIVGESHNKYHSSLYGYPQETNPLLSKKNLVVFSNVITPINLTSESFRSFLSYSSYNSGENWYEKPLFPAVLKKAGYNTIFYSNEFPRFGENNPWNAEAGFLYDGYISKKMFTSQNDYMTQYDGELLDVFIRNRFRLEKEHNLYMLQLRGQHIDPKERFPKDWEKFRAADYLYRSGMSDEERQQVANYDNACLYNDWIISRVIELFEDQDAIVIYFSDHGDEVNDFRSKIGRDYNDMIDENALHCQLDVPFFIYMTPQYQDNHPDIVSKINAAKDRHFSLTDLPHFVSRLSGIDLNEYEAEKDLIDSCYVGSQRFVVGNIDYDKVVVRDFEISFGY